MRVCIRRASPCGASVGPGLRRVCAAHTCARVLDGGPGPARCSRPVPSRSVEYRAAPRRSPPAIHSSFSQPARPTDCQCPTARRTVCTQKRSGSPSLPPYLCHPARTLSRRLSIGTPLRPSSSPTVALPRLPHRAAPILSPFFSSFSHTHVRARAHARARARIVLSFPLEIFSLSVRSARCFFASHSVPSKPLFALLCQLHSANARAPAIAFSLSFRRPVLHLVFHPLRVPSYPFLSLSRTRLASRLVPPSRHSTLPPRSARDSAVFVSPPPPAVLPLRFRLLSRLSVPLLPLALGSNAGVYSRCHLIAGRFSRVRYRSATESTQSAGARSYSDSSFSLSFSLFLFPTVFSPSFSPLSRRSFSLARSAFHSSSLLPTPA